MRLAKRCAILVAVGAVGLCTSPLAAIPIRYLEFPGGTVDGQSLSQALSQQLELELPCYGKVGIKVTPATINGTVPPVTYFEQGGGVQGQSATDPANMTVYTWGKDTNRFNVFVSQTTDYNVIFTFPTPPDPARLRLVVVGLATGSTATISTNASIPSNPAGALTGEFTFSSTPPSSKTLLNSNGTVLTSEGKGDQVNTGWALYQPKDSFTSLTVKMHQAGGDGLGWTLSYVCESTLTVKKVVQGAPPNFSAPFSFLVECVTPQGFFHTTVTATWPGAASVAVPGVPAGSTCTVVENLNLPDLPNSFAWAGTTYSPANGTVTTTAAGVTVTATNTVRPCLDTCSVRIVKKVVGAPPGFTGTFTGVLRCWINNALANFPVTLNYPGSPTATISNLPQGISCTFLETGRPVLPAPYQWLPPLYSKDFGQIDLVGACEHQIEVTNRTKVCCGDTPPSGPVVPDPQQ